MIDTFHFNHILNQLRVFVTRSRHKCSIGLNRLRVIWGFNKEWVPYHRWAEHRLAWLYLVRERIGWSIGNDLWLIRCNRWL